MQRLQPGRDSQFPEKKFTEVMLLKRIGDNAISFRKTLNGKFSVPTSQALYCRNDKQRMYRDVQARDRAEAKRKAAEDRVKPKTTN